MRNEQIFELVDAGIRAEMDLEQAGKYLKILMDLDIKEARVYKKYKCMVRLIKYMQVQRVQMIVAERIDAKAKPREDCKD